MGGLESVAVWGVLLALWGSLWAHCDVCRELGDVVGLPVRVGQGGHQYSMKVELELYRKLTQDYLIIMYTENPYHCSKGLKGRSV